MFSDRSTGRLDDLGRMPQRNINSPKVMSVTKSRKITHAVKQSSRNSHPSKDKPPIIDNHPSKEERQFKDHHVNDKHHAKHKHFSRHRYSPKKKDKETSEEKEENALKGNRHKDSKSKQINTRKPSSKGSTVLRRKQAYLKPGLLMDNK